MSAPISDQSLSSISSSGHVDGLGRRLLAFDRETGAILERLFLRPELAAFETTIRDRIDALASIEDERFARPGSVERDPATGALTVLSEFVAGSRLSDLLETAEEAGLVPGVDVALGFLLEALPALSSFHTASDGSHGLIAPPRIVLTPAGQVVFLDTPFAAIVERLGLSRSRLWVELGVAAPQDGAPVRLDRAADISQVALCAVMLVIGRRLRDHEYPESLPSLLTEVVEVAQIRGSSLFATSLQRLLQRSLPVSGRRPFRSADELANEIRLLLRREIGAEVCRQALVDFIEQMDAEFPESRSGRADTHAADNGRTALALDDLSLDALDSIEILEVEDDSDVTSTRAGEADEDLEDDDDFEEIELDPEPEQEPDLVLEPVLPPVPESPAPQKEIADPWSFDVGAAERLVRESAESSGPQPAAEFSIAEETRPAAATTSEETTSLAWPEPVAAAETTGDVREVPAEDAAEQAPTILPPQEDADIDAPASLSSRRKKRQYKSARARKDKLRSAAAPKPQPAVKPPEPRPQGGWIVNPDRAAAFRPAIPEPPLPQPPALVGHPAPAPVAQPVAALPPAPPPQIPMAPPSPVVPVVTAPPAAPIPMPVFGAPVAAPASAPTAPIGFKPVGIAQPKPVTPVRVKAQPPSGYTPQRAIAPPPAVGYVQHRQSFEAEQPRPFPWKLALVVLVAVGVAIAAGRAYLPSKSAPSTDDGAPAVSAPQPEPAVVVMPKVETGDITIETQPAGAQVSLDGKAVGQSPLKLADVPVGRHTLRLVSSSGEVTRTVRVEAGKTAVVDVPIFSGWVAVFAPVVLDVAIRGRSIGTTERDRLMLSAGRHELTLTNKELGYTSVQSIEIEPGAVRSITVDPRGPVNFNAVPWAEVWMDGKKLGDTPLANLQVPLGTREFVFKNPEHGERKVTATVRADQPSAIGVDFTRPE